MERLRQWERAVPAGQRILAAAPMVGEWVPRVGPYRSYPLLALFFGSMFIVSFMGSSLLAFAALWVASGVAIAGMLWLEQRWRRTHPPPPGMAGILEGPMRAAPVLLVTDSTVLFIQTGIPSVLSFRTRRLPLGRPLLGLVAINAVGLRLIARFADGSEAALRQQVRMPETMMARVADLAGRVLSPQA